MNKKFLISATISVFLAATTSTNSFAVNKDCRQADFNPDYVVKNGHSLDSNDLFTRHMVCGGENIPAKKNHNNINNTVVVIVKTPKPEIPPEPNPTKVCHNKNSGKDGTPEECNAGKGQEKHQ